MTEFGRAADLNRERSFNLQFGHHGPKLAYAGEALRAIDTPHGIAVDSRGNVWIADSRNDRLLGFRTPLTTDTDADFVLGQLDLVSFVANHSHIVALQIEDAASVAELKTFYEANCASCHGEDGAARAASGDRLRGLDFTNAKAMRRKPSQKYLKF